MAKQTYSRRELLRLTGKLAVSVGAASIVVTVPACSGGTGGGPGTLAGCDLVDSYTGAYYDEYGYPAGTATYETFYCDNYIPGADCVYSGYDYTCYDVRYDT
jgi:hypothetical protein